MVKYIYIGCFSYLFKWFLTVIHLSLRFEIEILLKYDLLKKIPFFTVFCAYLVCVCVVLFFYYYCSLLCRFRPSSSSVLGFALGTIVSCLSTSCHVLGCLLIHYSSFHGADLKSYFKTFCTDGSVKWALKLSMESPKVMQFGFTNKYH